MISHLCFASASIFISTHHKSRLPRTDRRCSHLPAQTVRMTATAPPSKTVSTEGKCEPVAESTLPASEVLKTPSHWRIPVIGTLIDAAIGNSGPELARRYGPFYRSNHFVGDAFIVAKHSTACMIQKESQLFTSRFSQASIENVIGKRNLATLDGAEHLRLRSVYAPLFGPQAMARFFDTARFSADIVWAEVVQRMAVSAAPVDIESSVKSHFLRVALAIIMKDFQISSVVSGNQLGTACLGNAQGSSALASVPLDSMTKALDTVFTNLYRPKIPPFVQSTQNAIHRMAEITAPILRERLERDAGIIHILRSGSDQLISAKTAILSKEMDFITVMAALSDIPTGTDLPKKSESIDQAIAERSKGIVGFFLAGFVTTAPTFLSCLKRIMQNPSLYAQLVEEQNEISELTLQAVKERMPLLSSTLNETLRYYPAAIVTPRHATEDVYIERHFVRKGEAVVTDVWAANRDGTVFEDPDVFDPYRFMHKARGGRSTPASAILTLGAPGSPHYCLGAGLAKMEIKTTIAVLLREYDAEIVQSGTNDFEAIPIMKPRSVKLCKCSPRAKGKLL